VKYVGVDWAYRTAQWCALAPGGEIAGEGRITADRDGLVRAYSPPQSSSVTRRRRLIQRLRGVCRSSAAITCGAPLP
jgi:hypothetical protein